MLLETSKLLKEYGRGYRRVYNQALNDFPKSVGFNTGLSAPQPDMIEGLDLREFKPFPVRHELGGGAVPTSENNATTLPHLAGEWKAGGKDMIQARTQAAYDGACMVYGRNEARSFLERPDPAGHAYVQTFTTDGTTLNTFAHYSSESQDQVKYHQYPTSSSFFISSYDDFRKSRRRLRNHQDDAKETSEKLRDELNKKWSENQQLDEDEDEVYEDSYELIPLPASASIPAETAEVTDCNSYECNDEEDPTSQLLTEYWTGFSANNQDDPFMQISTTDNGYTSPDALITPPQSSNDTSHPVKSNDIDDSNVRGHRRTRRTRTRAADPAEGLRDVDHESNVRKTRRKRKG
ncbi:hypothetical protein EG329_013644 [Mollisiaceae sp. DMI_Dod_QoI]|nr:hypothetical protein EG329_013644 [Helotiales sp. DMI_Dod_QoI]